MARYAGVLRLPLAIAFGVVAAMLGGVSPAAAAPPPNDDITNTVVIGEIPFAGSVDNSEATIENGELNFCGPIHQTVWYVFTPDATG